jgi:hypothetical protein
MRTTNNRTHDNVGVSDSDKLTPREGVGSRIFCLPNRSFAGVMWVPSRKGLASTMRASTFIQHHYYINDLHEHLLFSRASGFVVRSNKARWLLSIRPTPEHHFWMRWAHHPIIRVRPSAHHQLLEIISFPGASDGVYCTWKTISRCGWWHHTILKMVLWKQFITFSYDLGWIQILYQNCIAQQELKLCS